MKNVSPDQVQALLTVARECRERAYAPYSKYKVGAALLTAEGSVFGGCNVENASYGLSLCAERVAIGSAIAAGATGFTAIAVATDDNEPGTPCGVCRQTLVEFNPELTVIVCGGDGPSKSYCVRELLPDYFSMKPGREG